MSYIVLDIETVPDPELWSIEKANPRSKKKPEDQMPPLYACKVVVIGLAMFDDALELAGMSASAGDEPQLIQSVSQWLAVQDATLVTFNGRTFDLPLMALRALRHGLSQDFNTSDHRRRYSDERHLDLFDVLTEYGYLGKTGYNLDALTTVIGLGGKNGIDGSMVAGLYAKGEIDKIRGYCSCDLARQAFLLFRYLLMRGRISLEKYQHAAKALFAKCTEMGLTGVTFAADTKRLLLEG
jgi:predicted PolB exonuclease-like 3'-5' exonuclease